MTFTTITRHFAFLCVFLSVTPLSAELLDKKWQERRAYYSEIVDKACAGDQNAHDLLHHDVVEKQDVVAMNNLAWLYENKRCKFHQRDPKWSLGLYSASAGKDYPIGQVNFARYLMEGRGVMQQRDYAIEQFEKAINAGYGYAALTLGNYYMGREFISLNVRKATEMHRRAIENGADVDGVTKLGEKIQRANEAYVSAYQHLNAALNFTFQTNGDATQMGRQMFVMRDKACVFQVQRHLPNNYKFIFEVNLGALDSGGLSLNEGQMAGEDVHFLEVVSDGSIYAVDKQVIDPAGEKMEKQVRSIQFLIRTAEGYSEIETNLKLMMQQCYSVWHQL